MQLVYLASVAWSSFAQRSHKFVEWFHEHTSGAVLWVDPYPSRFPSPNDLRRLRMPSLVGGKQDVPRWLTVVRPRALPIEPLPVIAKINGTFWKNVLDDIERFVRKAPTLLAIGKPSALALELLQRLEDVPSLYDAMDDISQFYSGLSRFSISSKEKLIVRRATIVFASSTRLFEWWGSIRNDVKFVRNGLDAKATPTRFVHREERSRKIFGYVGAVARWFDWDWIIALATARPHDLVRVIGPVYVTPPRQLPPNLELLPPMQHQAAVQAMLDFEVGLIPFKNNKLTASVDPIKYYEYRALSLPVMSTTFGEMALRAEEEGTFLGDKRHIATLADIALAYRPTPEEISQFIVRNSWDARFTATGLLAWLQRHYG